MDAGIQFNQLGKGDLLINKNWNYKNLWGINAARQKLLDQFSYAKNMGFTIIYDTIYPKYNDKNILTLDNTGYNSDIWPLYDKNSHDDRISFYKKQIIDNKFNFICKIEFPENLNKSNIRKYADFFLSLISNEDFSWISNWVFFDNPEELEYITNTKEYKPKISPEDYTTFMKLIHDSLKSTTAATSIKIGGPGLFKGLTILNNNNTLLNDNSFYRNWLYEALDNGFADYIDFFTVQYKQDIYGLEYDNISSINYNLNQLLKKRTKSLNTLKIYSINQGRQELDKDSEDKLLDQAYYNISELLNCSKNGVTSIINCMTDPVNDLKLNPEYNENEDGYGLYSFDMVPKPQVKFFKFILTNLKNYSSLTKNSGLYNNSYADDITFLKNYDNNSELISIVWPKYKINNKIVLLPSADLYYYLMNGESNKITAPYEFNSSRDFILVRQILNTKYIDYTDLRSTIFKKYIYNINTRNNILKSIPSNYNTNIDDTNFYKLIRALCLEYADAKVQVSCLKDNMYLETAHKDAIYQNFGSMINFEKQYEWSYEKYRRLLQGIIKSLLMGPTKTAIEDVLNLFVNYENIYEKKEKVADVKIYELYENNDIDPSIYNNVHSQFAFIVTISKDIDANINQDALNRDLKYVVNLLKPAHTLSFVVIIISGNENYRQQYLDKYGVNFKDMDNWDIHMKFGGDTGIQEGIYGWKHINYDGCFHTWSKLKNHHLNSGILLGPRRILNEDDYILMAQSFNDKFIMPKEHIELLLEPSEINMDNYKSYHELKYGSNNYNNNDDNIGGMEKEYSINMENIYTDDYSSIYPYMFMTNITKLLANEIPNNGDYDNNMPIKFESEFKPLGYVEKMSDNVEIVLTSTNNENNVNILSNNNILYYYKTSNFKGDK